MYVYSGHPFFLYSTVHTGISVRKQYFALALFILLFSIFLKYANDYCFYIPFAFIIASFVFLLQFLRAYICSTICTPASITIWRFRKVSNFKVSSSYVEQSAIVFPVLKGIEKK